MRIKGVSKKKEIVPLKRDPVFLTYLSAVFLFMKELERGTEGKMAIIDFNRTHVHIASLISKAIDIICAVIVNDIGRPVIEKKPRIFCLFWNSPMS